MRRWLLLMLVAAVAGSAALPAVAAAFGPPELFWRDRNDTSGPWKPLAGAVVRSPAKIELGMRMQPLPATDRRLNAHVRLVTVPDGQPGPYGPFNDLGAGFCSAQAGTAGEIIGLRSDVSWEGDGPYALTVALYPDTIPQSLACTGPGPTTTAAWTVDTRPSLVLTGGRRIDFVGSGLRLDAVGEGDHEVVCARDARRRDDGSLTGSLVVRSVQFDPFPTSGRWSCTARTTASVTPPAGPDITVTGRWADPVAYTVRGSTPRVGYLRYDLVGRGTVRLRGKFIGLRAGRDYPPEVGAAGASLTFRVSETARCREQDRASGVRSMPRALTVRTRVRAGGGFDVRLPVPLPRGGLRKFDLSARFGGRPLLAAGRVPNFPALLGVDLPRRRAIFRTDAYC